LQARSLTHRSPLGRSASGLIIFLVNTSRHFSLCLSRCQAIALLWLVCAVSLGLSPARAQNTQGVADALVTNASPDEIGIIGNLLASLDRAVADKDLNTLRFFGLDENAAKYSSLHLDTQVTHLADSPAGALVRQNYEISGVSTPGVVMIVLTQGTHEFFLARGANNNFTWTNKHWAAPSDALPALADAAREEWERPAPGKTLPPDNSLLHLVAARRGGRWIALRR
jgi:hypothetical protein